LKKLHILALLIGFIATMIFQSCGSSGSTVDTDDPEKAFSIAKGKFDKGNYLDAIDDFSFIKVKFPGSQVSDKVQFYLAESYFYKGEYLLAAYEYSNFQKNYGLSAFIPESKYKLGVCYYKESPKPSLDQEYTRYAISELSLFVDQYPNDKNVTDANVKLQDLKDKLAYKDYSTGIIYMKMEHYRAAALYFQSVYENYIETQWADDAMLGHADALINSKKYDDAKKVLEKFDKLFPKSDLKPRAYELRKSIPVN
jgi:outer membrane protein assembly factor BamD